MIFPAFETFRCRDFFVGQAKKQEWTCDRGAAALLLSPQERFYRCCQLKK